jgi:hypothetical protein
LLKQGAGVSRLEGILGRIRRSGRVCSRCLALNLENPRNCNRTMVRSTQRWCRVSLLGKTRHEQSTRIPRDSKRPLAQSWEELERNETHSAVEARRWSTFNRSRGGGGKEISHAQFGIAYPALKKPGESASPEVESALKAHGVKCHKTTAESAEKKNS